MEDNEKWIDCRDIHPKDGIIVLIKKGQNQQLAKYIDGFGYVDINSNFEIRPTHYKRYNITKDDLEKWGKYTMDYFVDILNGEYDTEEARQDLISLIASVGKEI